MFDCVIKLDIKLIRCENFDRIYKQLSATLNSKFEGLGQFMANAFITDRYSNQVMGEGIKVEDQAITHIN